MNSLVRLSKGLIASGMLLASGLGLVGCGPDYALFKLQVATSSPRNTIDHCAVSVTDQTGACVLREYQFPAGPIDSTGNFVQFGCAGGLTPSKVGDFSWSTSQVTGTFTFQVNAYDANSSIEQSATSSAVAAKPYPPEMPAIGILTQATEDAKWNPICGR
jgi:hypothetical protein